ncbi:hexitol phosphatase HxpB [Ferrimonas marina]|uniref:hexitol phosphatase HxpB n=1 Tax=Ferrimonas marina TaxID=299255 RepID=UPI0022866791|nr:hexitol phosphatase HxpB [Ferrimonas marina]
MKAIIFDMDGVLVDSEPLWQQAELAILPKYGVPLTFEDTLKTQGLRIDQLVHYWHQRFPWQGASIEAVADELVQEVARQIRLQGRALPGVAEAMAVVQASGLPVALATSSPGPIIDATLERLQLQPHFQACLSAEHLAYGKPHPEVYLNAAAAIDVAPERCLAIEDSFNGILAAKAARMQVLAIPDDHHRDDPRFVIADHRMDSLKQLTAPWLQQWQQAVDAQ